MKALKWLWENAAKAFIFGTAGFLVLVVVLGQQIRDEKVIKQDVVQYYSYLPAAFIHGDLSMSYAHGDPFFADKVWGTVTDEGAFVQKYTMGLALMYAPFFGIGHLHAQLTDAPADGYSQPYELWLQFGAIFWLVLGLWILRKVLRRYFSEWTIAITLFVLVYATNLFVYATAQGPMPHAFLFCLVSLFLFLTLRFHEYPTWKNTVYLALVGGLIVLIRPNHLLIWAIPVLYDLDKGKWGWWKKQLPKVALWPLIVLVVVSPQLFYWKTFTGDWIFWSYGNEGFFFDDPALASMWFSFRKGWLIYTPVMVLGLVGLFSFGSLTGKWRVAAWVFFVASTYVLSSWWCWWYGGSYSQRVMIDLYPVLAIGMASLRHAIYPIKWLNRVLVGFIVVCTMLNVLQTWQYVNTFLHYDSMTAAAYKASFGRTHPPEGFEALLDPPDYEAARQGDR